MASLLPASRKSCVLERDGLYFPLTSIRYKLKVYCVVRETQGKAFQGLCAPGRKGKPLSGSVGGTAASVPAWCYAGRPYLLPSVLTWAHV